MPKIRWFMLVLGMGMLIPTILRQELWCAIIAFVLGLPCGLMIDFIGSKILKLWDYNGGFALGYFLITLPCWGIFSMTVNLLWNWIRKPWAFIIIAIVLFGYLELPNLETKSWSYSVPLWFVAIGWFPLVLGFRIVYILFLQLLDRYALNAKRKEG